MIKPKNIKQSNDNKFNKDFSPFPNLKSLKLFCKKEGITNSVLYKQKYRQYGLPAHPERIYEEWISYKDFFDIADFISYVELKEIISDKNFKNAKE